MARRRRPPSEDRQAMMEGPRNIRRAQRAAQEKYDESLKEQRPRRRKQEKYVPPLTDRWQ